MWTISDLNNRMVKFCPFCGSELKKQKPEKFNNINECFIYIKEVHGFETFFDTKKLLSYISDYMPELTVEKRILKVALEAGIYKHLISQKGDIIYTNYNKAKFVLVNEYGISEKWAEEAVSWIIGSVEIENPISVKESENKITEKEPNSDKIIIGSDEKGQYKYEGKTNFKNIPNGQGTITYKSGEMFTGEFVDGKLNGNGTWKMINGDIFNGVFKNGKQSKGQGILTKGDVTYTGLFYAGLRMHGKIEVKRKFCHSVRYETYENGHQKWT